MAVQMGSWIAIAGGQRAFLPAPVPRELVLPPELIMRLDRASRSVAMLAGVGETLPNPHLLIRPFARREAVLSSRLEGTQTSLSQLLLFEASRGRNDAGDTREVANYVSALELGLEKLQSLPLSVRLFNDLHFALMDGVRGRDRRPGELRQQQVWISTDGTQLHEARFVPPPPDRVRDLLTDLERFVNDDEIALPPLVRCAVMHYQFEAIHPYLDGNGRVGRLLITLFLCAQRVLTQPLLYVSAYLEPHRDEYLARLHAVSAEDDLLGWISFFLEAVEHESLDAIARARRLRDLHEAHRQSLQERHASANTMRLLDVLFEWPIISTTEAARALDVTYAGAKRVLERMVEIGIVEVVHARGPAMYAAPEIIRTIDMASATE